MRDCNSPLALYDWVVLELVIDGTVLFEVHGWLSALMASVCWDRCCLVSCCLSQCLTVCALAILAFQLRI